MSVMLVAALFSITPSGSVDFSSPSSASSHLAGQVQTGTLLVSKGDCLAVKVFTCSRYTHVAAVVVEDGKPYVYESANGHGVRRQTLNEYLEAECPNCIYVLNPKQPFTPKRSKAFCGYLKSQLGMPYAIKHHFTGKRGSGVHCSEYITDALMTCRLMHANRPSRVSPASLAMGVLQSNVYEAGEAVDLTERTERPEGSNRCEQMWIDTKSCTAQFCVQMRRWFVCR